MRIAVDTNVLLRIANQRDPLHAAASAAYVRLSGEGHEVCFTAQNVAEFWNVTTRPLERNGFGLSSTDADDQVRTIERTLRLLPARTEVYPVWRELVVAHDIKGRQVHDAMLAAMYKVHGVERLLTSDTDFSRFTWLCCLTPDEVLAGAR